LCRRPSLRRDVGQEAREAEQKDIAPTCGHSAPRKAARLFSQELAGILNRIHGPAIRASRNGGERRVLPSCLEPYTACSLSAETCRSHPARGRATAIRRRHETAK